MYTFLDKADRSLSLRPEGTAPVMRAFVENGLAQNRALHKLYYIGPMFRYDRPQSGRYRQHHQFGVECIGNSGFATDAEIIDLFYEFFRRLGLKNVEIAINSVGDDASREDYKKSLISYLDSFKSHLSSDSQIRLEKNPLRILDSKDPKDQEILEKAPSILNHLSPASKTHFESVLSLLDKLSIPYRIQDRLVRGLDYYNDTVFEAITKKPAVSLLSAEVVAIAIYSPPSAVPTFQE